MISKRVPSAAEAVAAGADDSSIMIGGFGEAGSPIGLIHALIDQGASGLTVISNNTGSGEGGLAASDQDNAGTRTHHAPRDGKAEAAAAASYQGGLAFKVKR